MSPLPFSFGAFYLSLFLVTTVGKRWIACLHEQYSPHAFHHLYTFRYRVSISILRGYTDKTSSIVQYKMQKYSLTLDNGGDLIAMGTVNIVDETKVPCVFFDNVYNEWKSAHSCICVLCWRIRVVQSGNGAHQARKFSTFSAIVESSSSTKYLAW